MKVLGDESELKLQRNEELLRLFQLRLMEEGVIHLKDCIRKTINSPCSRFWVTPSRALLTIRKMLAGDDLHRMTATKQELYGEIFRRVKECRELHPSWSLKETVAVVVKQPAPKFYLTVGTAIVYLHHIQNVCRKNQLSRLRRSF